MSTIVYQELQPSCTNTESFFVESRTLNLKLNNFSKVETEAATISGGWSAIEALPSKSDSYKTSKDEPPYVHPLVKRSSFMLSEKSLEMCTESLGNESGCCSMESGLFSFPSTTTTTTMKMQDYKPRQKLQKRKTLIVDHGKFPPPLTTISGGSNPIHVKQYREEGRLVLEAVCSPPIQSYLQSERSDGRLKLSIVRALSTDDIKNDEEENYCDSQIMDNDVVEEFLDDEMDHEKEIMEVDVVEKEDLNLEECNSSSKENDANFFEDMNGITVEFGVKLGLGKIHRPTRCKERGQGNKRLINWESFWVAT
ncbi:protein FANTASTIC FOUR 1 [Beta vulgaris subsp. vulgaris]|uniref:protein FANTASTIC FOUR 1 n=1 Tax=Beta vulgaris subsp. vulgaris TaxID=3555 RepID=UPI002036ED1C|nr:protein FANTASTIC FOUR 1 [Beta vulgaris subsp. vulgaris]